MSQAGNQLVVVPTVRPPPWKNISAGTAGEAVVLPRSLRSGALLGG